MKEININCDVGEGIHNEEFLLPYIQSCNIACGGHAGDSVLMKKVVGLALKNKVKIGAHPSYPDLENFGRKTIQIEREELIKSIQSQIDSLLVIVNKLGGKLHHIKPHGALYNDIVKDENLALLFLNAIEKYKKTTKLFVPYNSAIEKQAIKKGFTLVYEAFADRNYNDDLSLVSRREPNSLITSIDEVMNHVEEMKNKGVVTTVHGLKIKIKAETFCVHSDTKNAVEIVKFLNRKAS